jgi:hypothetical protein
LEYKYVDTYNTHDNQQNRWRLSAPTYDKHIHMQSAISFSICESSHGT